LHIKLVIIKKLYYDARPTKYQVPTAEYIGLYLLMMGLDMPETCRG